MRLKRQKAAWMKPQRKSLKQQSLKQQSLEAIELEAIELEATELEAEDSAEPDTTEAASAPVEPDGGSNTTWVAPVLIGAVAVVGAGVFMVRRKPAA